MASEFENIHDLDDLSDRELRDLVRSHLRAHNGLDADYITVRTENGAVILDGPVQLPDGARVEVHPVDDPDRIGIPEEEQGDDPESIAAWIAWANQLEPLKWTDEERAEWEKALAEQKAFELATWEERSRKLEKLFE